MIPETRLRYRVQTVSFQLAIFLVASVLLTNMAFAQQPPPPPPAPTFPPVPHVTFPVGNGYSEAKRILGKVLFWDEQLSSDNSMACGTCHIPSSGGGDPRSDRHPGADGVFFTADDVFGSPGVVAMDANGDPINDPTFGTAPQVTGRAAQSYFANVFADSNFWDGRATSEFRDPQDDSMVVIAEGGALESQAVGPILSSVEMAHADRTWYQVIAKLESITPLLYASDIPQDMEDAVQANSTYGALFEAAFGDDRINAQRIGKAIATYERTLVADETPWDLYNAGNQGAMTAAQIRGWDFFAGSRCTRCHTPPLFTDNQFHNIGLRPAVEDFGREAITGNPNDRGRFKTPTLRNTGLRANLMHVGFITGVPDAINFYNEQQGRTQFDADQSGIPTNQPGVFENYDQARVPGNARDDVIDFIANALTDPRVASETYPFDRPTLHSEMGPEPVIYYNANYVGFEDGTEPKPYNTCAESLVHVEDGGSIVVVNGVVDETVSITKAVTLTGP